MKYDFKTKQGIIVPFLRIKITKESVSRICLSPIVEYDIARNSVRELLKNVTTVAIAKFV